MTTATTKSKNTKVTTDQVFSFLKGNKRTIKDVAGQFLVTTATARKHILRLSKSGVAKQEGTRQDKEIGRPAFTYTA